MEWKQTLYQGFIFLLNNLNGFLFFFNQEIQNRLYVCNAKQTRKMWKRNKLHVVKQFWLRVVMEHTSHICRMNEHTILYGHIHLLISWKNALDAKKMGRKANPHSRTYNGFQRRNASFYLLHNIHPELQAARTSKRATLSISMRSKAASKASQIRTCGGRLFS